MPKTIARTPEAIRAALLADPNVTAMAKTLEIPLEDYIAQVIHFAMNPDAQPEVVVLSEEDLKRHNLAPPPSAEEIGRFLIEEVSLAKAGNPANEFSAHKTDPVSLGAVNIATQTIEKTDEKLKEELMKQLRVKRDGR